MQPQAAIVAPSAIPFEEVRDRALTRRVRSALMPQYELVSDSYATVRYDIRAVNDWEKWTYTIAGQFGLSPVDTAMFPPFAPPGTRGDPD